MSRMLYKHPGQHALHGDMFDYVIVDELEVDKFLNVGWSMTTTEALNLNVIDADIIEDINTKDTHPPTRDELEAKATELGIKFRSNTKDETLSKKIDEALNVVD